jgi:hypothetical protein
MREACIGIGAHTHYWDETARAVGEELDRRLLGLQPRPEGGAP